MAVCVLSFLFDFGHKRKKKEKENQQANKLKHVLKRFLIDGLFCAVRQSIHLLLLYQKKLFPTLSLLEIDEETRGQSAFSGSCIKMQLLPKVLELIQKMYPRTTLPNSGNHPATYCASFTEEALSC